MNIRHHVGDDTLLAYVNGTLAETISVVVATHLAICPGCRQSVAMMEELAGEYLTEADDAELSPEEASMINDILREQINVSEEIVVPNVERFIDKGVPAPLAEKMPVSLDDIPWKKLVPGISHFPLPKSGNKKGTGTLRLLKIAPGKTMPEHSHSSQELTLVLRGSYIDDLGRFQTGDIADLDGQIWHQPVADTSEDCICLIATDAPLMFNGLFSKLLQPIFGI